MTLNFKEHHLALENKRDSELQLWDICPPLPPRWDLAEQQHFSADKAKSSVATVRKLRFTFQIYSLLTSGC